MQVIGMSITIAMSKKHPVSSNLSKATLVNVLLLLLSFCCFFGGVKDVGLGFSGGFVDILFV